MKIIKLLVLFLTVFSCSDKPKRTVHVNEQSAKPNILMILIDDLKPTLGTYGDSYVVSPNIDNLASSGMRFNKAYANQAVCVASRYNILLGSRSTSTGIYGFANEFRDVIPDAVTMPQYFQKAGYHTEAIGKVFHVGHGNTNDEASWSVPHHKEKVIEYLVPESTGRKLTREEAFFENTRLYIEDTPSNKELPRGAAWESPDVVDDAYADGRSANHAIDRLRSLKKNQDKPFFMALGFARPHLPFSVPKKYWDMYDPSTLPMPKFEGKPEGAPDFVIKKGIEIDQFEPIPEKWGIYPDSIKRKLIHGYYASVSYMDAQLGRVMDELKRLELDKNTIIVLWGDHGWHLGDHAIWTKHTNFEQATRIPLLIVAPGVTTPNSSTEQIAESVDVFPTLADLAGLKIPDNSSCPQPIDGVSLLPILKKQSEEVKTHAYHCFTMGGYLGEAIRTKNHRMVRWSNLKDNNDVIYELYDFENDYSETKNIAEANPEKVKELVTILDGYPKAVIK
ncbi:sulfatase [uncultured Algibacter sp.]|uniref:sulfatase n=1 Tax=uncultured Algibacter sp. TaxID=298659 RepID=UPI0026383105|nr:sulfatase [uncultured Algibacter sp.]